MTIKVFRFIACLFIALSMFSSCATDDSGITENFIDESTEKICSESRTGGKGCFEFVFPITIVFADESTVAVNSYEEMKNSFRTWKEANPGATERTIIQFPYSVTTEDGTVVTIESKEQLRALVATCKADGPGKGPKDHGRPCFTINFPFSVTTSTGTVVVTTKQEFAEILRTAKKNKERVQYVFPLTLTLKDGTTKVVNNVEELRAVKAACKKG